MKRVASKFIHPGLAGLKNHSAEFDRGTLCSSSLQVMIVSLTVITLKTKQMSN